MKYLSLFSGIEAATAAWHPLGWECVAVSDIEPFPCALLAHHYPDVPNLGDVTQITEFDIMALGPIDIVVFGSPCQDLSVAGNRKGLTNADGTITRSGLFFTAINIFNWARKHCGARFALWENVPGAFSSAQGRDFGAVVEFMAGVDGLPVPPKGWGTEGVCLGDNGLVEWAVLDAQWFGVAQRRRRVFALLDTGDWAGRPPILLEPESVRGDTAPRRGTGQDAARGAARSVALRGREGGGAAELGDEVGNTLRASAGGGDKAHVLTHAPLVPVGTDCFNGAMTGDVAASMGTRGSSQNASGPTVMVPVAFAADDYKNGTFEECNVSRPLTTSADRTRAAPINVQAVAFSCKDYGADVGSISPTLRAMGHGASHANAGGQVAVAFQSSQSGVRVDEVGQCLRASKGGGDKPHVLAPVVCETLYNKGFTHKESEHASAQETYPGTLLRALRQEVGEKTFAEWGLGILDSLQQKEVLQQALHGVGVRPAAFSRSWVVNCALSRPESRGGWLLQSLREAGCERCASQGWEPPEQLSRELGAYLSELSQPGAQAARLMRDLWQAAEGFGLLRQALSAIQEMGRPAHGQSQPAHGGMQVRRLTPEECEFLQGFPRGYTLTPYRNKPAADGPRYKALGNSMAVPVMRWIGMRVQRAVDLQGLLS